LNQDDDFVEDDDQGGYIDNGEVEEEQFSDEYETPAKKCKLYSII
jgi:DNA polymerase alpha subunit A